MPTSDLKLDCLVHDLNNVFQTLAEAADLVGSDPNWSSVSAIMLRSIEQGHRIVTSILEKEIQPVPFEDLTERAAVFSQDCMAFMRGPVLQFEHEIEDGLKTSLAPAALERVLVNLFINAGQAARSAERDSCRINVAAHSNNHHVEIEVSDDGPGIPMDALTRMFTPGFSTDRSRTGLGLHIVETLVSEAGGSVTAANRSAGGARFKIVLPAARPVAAVAH